MPGATSADVWLIALALAGIGLLVVLVSGCRVNAFLALLASALLVGGGAVLLGAGTGGRRYTMAGVLDSIRDGLGATLGGIAAVLALGAMLGKLLAESGGAEVLAERLTNGFGSRRIVWCVLALGAVVGVATWFAVGLMLLTPIVLTLARRIQQPFVVIVLPLLAVLSVTHGLLPPHPGPVVAATALHTDMGLVLLWGAAVAVPTVLIAGPGLAWWLKGKVRLEPPAAGDRPAGSAEVRRRPGPGVTLVTVLLPVVLMLLATVSELLLPAGHLLRAGTRALGHPTVALLLAVAAAWWVLGLRCGHPARALGRFTEESVAGVGMTLLVVGGGGAFARVLGDAGVADALGRMAESLHLSPLMYGWLLAAFVRVATGSATVAITTAAGLLAPVIAGHPGFSAHQIALTIVALGSGSLVLSHLNDGGFWIVKDCLGLTLGQTLRTWTVCETVIGLVGLGVAWACSQLVR